MNEDKTLSGENLPAPTLPGPETPAPNADPNLQPPGGYADGTVSESTVESPVTAPSGETILVDTPASTTTSDNAANMEIVTAPSEVQADEFVNASGETRNVIKAREKEAEEKYFTQVETDASAAMFAQAKAKGFIEDETALAFAATNLLVMFGPANAVAGLVAAARSVSARYAAQGDRETSIKYAAHGNTFERALFQVVQDETATAGHTG